MKDGKENKKGGLVLRRAGLSLKSILSGSTAVLVSVAAAPAFAQGEGDDVALALDVITVQAQKRSENLQDVPVSVTSLNPDRIVLDRVESIQALDASIANLSFSGSGNRGNPPAFSIRGVGSAFSSRLPRSTIIVDNAPLADLRGLDFTLFDVEQIQVLRGPQSTLFGLTSEGGVVLVDTRKPTNEYQAKANFTYAEFDDIFTNATVSGPIIEDKILFSLSGNYREFGGFIENVATGEKLDQESAWAIRPRLIINPTDNLSIDLVWTHSEIDSDFGQLGVPAVSTAFAPVIPSLGEFEAAQNNPGFSKQTKDNLSAVITLDLGGYELTSVTAYSETDLDYLYDIDLGPFTLPAAAFMIPIDPDGAAAMGFNNFFTQELRITSPSDKAFRWLGGLFYSDRQENTDAFFASPGDASRLQIADSEVIINTYAAFVDANFDVTEQLTIGGGLRYEKAEGEVNDPFSFPTPAVGVDTDSDVFLPRATVTYSPTDDVSIYAKAARGWLPGIVVPVVGGAPNIVDRETMWSYEAGLKSELFDRRLRFNAAVFYSEISDYQESFRLPNTFIALDNAGDVNIFGFEIEANALITEGLIFDAAFGYADSEFDQAIVNGFDVSGNQVPGIPLWDLDTSLTYTFMDDFFARAQLQATGEGPFLEDSTNAFFDQGVVIGDARILNFAVGYNGDNFGVQVFVNNATDDRYLTGAVDQFSGGMLSGVSTIPGRPRQVGVRLNVEM